MPHIKKGYTDCRKCKYCELPAKVNYIGIKRRHKGYLRTCGGEECLHKQYFDRAVSAKKSYFSKNVFINCKHCGEKLHKQTITQKWCKKCVPDNKSRAIMRRYGMSYKEYLGFVDKTNGKCEICLKNVPTVVDHCHKSGNVRGFICQHCNVSLNLIENKDALKRAILYIKRGHNLTNIL